MIEFTIYNDIILNLSLLYIHICVPLITVHVKRSYIYSIDQDC